MPNICNNSEVDQKLLDTDVFVEKLYFYPFLDIKKTWFDTENKSICFLLCSTMQDLKIAKYVPNLWIVLIEFHLAPITVELDSYCACAIGIYFGTCAKHLPLALQHSAAKHENP